MKYFLPTVARGYKQTKLSAQVLVSIIYCRFDTIFNCKQKYAILNTKKTNDLK